MKKEKGITLITLVITIVIMLIIAAVAITTGTETLDTTELQGFYSQLEVIQKKIDDIATTEESYSGLGSALKPEQLTNLQKILNNEGSELGLNASAFRYFTIAELESDLGLSDIDYNVFVDFKSRTVVAEEGITIKSITYHLLPNTTYFVGASGNKKGVNKITFEITNFTTSYYNYYATGTNKIEQVNNTYINTLISGNKVKNLVEIDTITVKPLNSSNEIMSGGTVKYKKATDKYWKVADGLSLEIIRGQDEMVRYNVIYEDSNKNTVSATIRVYTSNDSYGTPAVDIVIS